MNRTALTTVALLAANLALAACTQDTQVESTATPAVDALETPPAMSEPEVPGATVRVTSINLGTQIGDDRTIAAPLTSFPADTDTIHISITTTNEADGETMGTLGVRWTFDDANGTQLVDEHAERFAFAGQDVTSFYVTNPDGWPMGSYTVEVSIDDEVVEARRFTVQ